ncbi:MAG: tetratricopeptide repeat protein [Bryobacteraceae bacterium]
MAIKPDFAEALINLGQIRQSEGDERQALEYFQKALDLKPELARAYFEPASA